MPVRTDASTSMCRHGGAIRIGVPVARPTLLPDELPDDVPDYLPE
jgi:hypothetical protein